MESVKQWLQDWSDACEYANECVPDLSFMTPQEPYSALASIGAACFLIWWWNERQFNRGRIRENQASPGDELVVPTCELASMADRVENVPPAHKQAA